MNITVSDDLHHSLQFVKESINISAVCQKALELEANRQHLLLRAGLEGEMDEWIQKLRNQREYMKNEAYEYGKSEGVKDAIHLDYLQVMKVVEVANHPDKDPSYGRLLEDISWLQDQVHQIIAGQEIESDSEDAWLCGWCDGVKETWKQVKSVVME